MDNLLKKRNDAEIMAMRETRRKMTNDKGEERAEYNITKGIKLFKTHCRHGGVCVCVSSNFETILVHGRRKHLRLKFARFALRQR